MACENNVCGTGDYSGPQPGDPSNALSLSANVVYGGINVSWSYPTTNPFAVAHTIVYRGTNNVFGNAIQLAITGGGSYLDRVEDVVPTTYYYWIQIISVHGTVAAAVGPASTTSVPRAVQTVEDITGRIDTGVLSNALKTQIASITLTDGRISDEIQNRINSNAGLLAMITAANGAVAQAMTYVQNEVTARTAGDSALVDSLTTLGTAVGSNLALFQSEKTLRTTKDASYASNFELLFTKVGDSAAAVTEETDARVAQYGALAERITTTEVSVFGNVATGQVGLSTYITTANNTITEIGALYTAKLTVNGLVGGFGVYNNGTYVEAGFDVDTFWIGRTNASKVKPFIVDNGVVYIDKARIRNADIDSLKIAGEAVTVPLVVTGPNRQRRGVGEGTWTTVNSATMNMTEPGLVYILATSAQGFINNSRYWAFQLWVNGQNYRQIMGRVANDAPVMSLALPFVQGVNRVELKWSAHPDVVLGYTELFLIGSKR